MENWKLYVDLGYGIPRYAVMEILRAMRDEAEPDGGSAFDNYVKCIDGFGVGNNSGLGMSLLANSRCVGLELAALHFEQDEFDGKIIVRFSKREKGVALK